MQLLTGTQKPSLHFPSLAYDFGTEKNPKHL